MRRIRQADIIVNEPLPWALYDEKGHLLLREGFVISMTRHIDRLFKRGVFIIAAKAHKNTWSASSH